MSLPHLSPAEQRAYEALTAPDIDVTTGVGVCEDARKHGGFERHIAAVRHLNFYRAAFTPANMVSLYRQLSEERAEVARLRGMLDSALDRLKKGGE
jgi:hypothetical protein